LLVGNDSVETGDEKIEELLVIHDGNLLLILHNQLLENFADPDKYRVAFLFILTSAYKG
jgi:hypothetical protein